MTTCCSFNTFGSMEAPPRLSFSTDFCCLLERSHVASPSTSEAKRKRQSVYEEEEEVNEDFEDISFEFSNAINLVDPASYDHLHHHPLQSLHSLLPSADELFCNGKLRPLASSKTSFSSTSSKNRFPVLESPPRELCSMASGRRFRESFTEETFDRTISIEKSKPIVSKTSPQNIPSSSLAMAMAFPPAESENDMLVPLHYQMNFCSTATENRGSVRVMQGAACRCSENDMQGMTGFDLNEADNFHDATSHGFDRSLTIEDKPRGLSSRKYVNLKTLGEDESFHDSDRNLGMEGKRRGFSSRKYVNLKTLDEDDAFDYNDRSLNKEDKPRGFSSRKYVNLKSLVEDDVLHDSDRSLAMEDKARDVSGRKYVNFKSQNVKSGSKKWSSSISKSLNNSCSCSPSRSASEPAYRTTPSSPYTASHASAPSEKIRTKGETGNKNNIMDLFRLKKCRSCNKEALLQGAVKEKGSSECKASSGSSFWRLRRSNSSSGKKKSGQATVPYPRRNSDGDVTKTQPSSPLIFAKDAMMQQGKQLSNGTPHACQSVNKQKSLSFRQATSTMLLACSQTEADNTNPTVLNHVLQESHASSFDASQVNQQATTRNSLPNNSPVHSANHSLQRNPSIQERMDQSKFNTSRYNIQSKGLTGARMDVRVAPVLNMPVCMIPSSRSKILSLGSIFSKKDRTIRGYSKLHQNKNPTGG